MKRAFAIFAAVAIAAVIILIGLGRTGSVDMKKPVAAIPSGAVPHGGAEKPLSEQTTGSARQ
jgi:hypothetical protein